MIELTLPACRPSLGNDRIAGQKASRLFLEKVHNRFHAQRCFIIDDAAGVNEDDWSWIKNEFTFCLDRSYGDFMRRRVLPSIYLCMDPHLLRDEAERIVGLPGPKFFSIDDFDRISNRGNCCFLASNGCSADQFFKDLTAGVPRGQAAVLVAMELAFHMGFQQVFIIGLKPFLRCDLRLGSQEMKTAVVDGGISSQVDPPPPIRLEPAEDAFCRMAKIAFESDGRVLIDATRNGTAALFSKTSLSQIAAIDGQIASKCPSCDSEAQLNANDGEYEWLVTAIVSTYNSARFIQGCLEDLERQSIAERMEIIVIISGSEQDESRIVEDFSLRHRNIRVVQTETRETVYQAWNRGIKLARGKYLTNANTDDRHHPEAFEKMVLALEADPSKVLAYVDQKYFKESGDNSRAFMFDRDRGAFCRRRLLQECFVGSQPMWRASLHEKYGYFDEAFFTAGDYEFWLRISQHHEFLHLHELLGERLIRSDSLEYEGNSFLSCYESSIIQKCYEYANVNRIAINRLGLSQHPIFSGWCELNLIRQNTISRMGKKTGANPASSTPIPECRPAGVAPLLSVVITTFNRRGALLQNLSALNQQTCKRFEVVIVNNGEPVPELAEGRFRMEFSCRYIENLCNLGPSQARNLGVMNSSGNLVAILDDDAIAAPGWAQSIIRHFEDERVVALRGRVRPKSGEPHVHVPVNYDLGEAELYNTAGLEMNTAFRKELFAQLGGFDEFMFGFEGAELSFRIFMACGSRVDCIRYFPDITTFHDYTDDPDRLLETQLRLKAMRRIANKKWPGLDKYISFMWGMIPANQQNGSYAWLTENAIFCSKGSPEESVTFADRAIALDDTEPLAFLIRGNALFKLDDYPMARESFERAAGLVEQLLTHAAMDAPCRKDCERMLNLSRNQAAMCCERSGDLTRASCYGKKAAEGAPAGDERQRFSGLPQQLIKRSQMRLAAFRHLHRGQRCIIIGNGPSLNRMDLTFLGNEITFGMNRIYLMFEKWSFRPTYYVSVNPLVLEQSAQEILKINAPKFLSHKGIPFFPEPPDDVMFIRSIPKWVFSTDPRNGLCEGWTVTYFAMQLAYYMGFEEVVLIGVDHHFVTQGDPNQEVVSEGDDPNHFHPGYFGKGVRWHLPDLERSEKSYRMAKSVFEAAGRRILDATVDGRLTVFPKVDYRNFFSRPSMKTAAPMVEYETDAGECLRQARDLTKAGKAAEASALLCEAIRRFPENAALAYAAGVLTQQCSDRRNALPYFESSVRLEPNNPHYLNALALGYHEVLGRSADALDLLKRALQFGCDRTQTCRNISSILESVGQTENARYFERASLCLTDSAT